MDRIEVKFANDAVDGETGEFKGYGSVFGNVDSHGDVIVPGAFAESLAEWSAKGRLPAMKLMHGTALNPFSGDDLPIGVWKVMREDARGLYVEGKLSGLNTDHGRRIHGLMKDGALDGLSIGYRTKSAERGVGPNQPKRTIRAAHLAEVSIVGDPSNGSARVTDMKAIDRDLRTAIKELGDAIDLHQRHMDGSEPTDMASQKKMMRMMERAYEAMTAGKPDGMKTITTIRDFEDWLRDAGSYSNAQAKAIASRGFKAAEPRDEDEADLLARLRRNIATLTP